MPELIRNEGHACSIASLNDADRELRRKLVEESCEACDSESDEQLAHELADVLEVIYALANAAGVSSEHVERVRTLRRMERGAFTDRLFLRYVDERDDCTG